LQEVVVDQVARAEPTNPATLFLRRARHLVNHNFLQLMKELAPDAMPEVARIVGVDPDTVEIPPSQ
jgi:type VI secretion system protein ImpA